MEVKEILKEQSKRLIVAQKNAMPQVKEIDLIDPNREPLSADALQLMSLPISELDNRVQSGYSTVTQLTQQLNDAETAYAWQTRPYLFSSPEAHAIALRDHSAALIDVEKQVQEAAATVREAAQIIDEATAEDREVPLSDTDMVRANAAREFVKENCAMLTLGEIRAKVQHALQTGDTPQAWLYMRYGAQRLNEHREEDRNSKQEAETLQTVLRSVKEGLRDTSGRETNARAKDLRLAAARLEGRAKARTAFVESERQYNHLLSKF